MYNYVYITWNGTKVFEYTEKETSPNVQLRVYSMKRNEWCWIPDYEIFMLS